MKFINYIFGLFNGAAVGAAPLPVKREYTPDAPACFSGKSIAQKMLFAYGLYSVRIETSNDELSDGYNLADNIVVLSLSAYFNESVIAMATACHEVGHAILCSQGASGSTYEMESSASALALIFLKKYLNSEQLGIATSFLNSALKTYQ